MKNMKNIFHIIAIVASAIVSALSASGMGGDPFIGAMIGGTVNTVIAAA